MRGPETIDDVLAALDEVIAGARRDGDRIGYFAAIYRQVTAKVAEGIATGFFDDNERMERLDVVFASRYLDALHRYRQHGGPSRSWELAFEAASARRPVILQHLLVGINAHINLDLGIAAATVAPGDRLPALRRDFDRINEILASLLAGIEQAIGTVSPFIALLSRIGGRRDDEVVRFSIEVARTQAWRFAVELAPLAPDDWSGPVSSRDAVGARVGRGILHPGLLSAGLVVIRAGERAGVARVIDVLAGVTPPALSTVERRVQSERSPPR